MYAIFQHAASNPRDGRRAPGRWRRFGALLLCLALSATLFLGCTQEKTLTFQDIAEDEGYARNVYTLMDPCVLDIDPAHLEDLENTPLFESEAGTIQITRAEWVSSNTVELACEAHGVIGEELATLVTACLYNEEEGYQESELLVTPSEDVHVTYSMQTTEWEPYGNRFSILFLLPTDEAGTVRKDPIQLTIQYLLQVEFEKRSMS